jgi:hypothetical protein
MKKKTNKKVKKKQRLETFEITEYGTYSKRWWIEAKSQKEAWEKRHDVECLDLDFYPSEEQIDIFDEDDDDEL